MTPVRGWRARRGVALLEAIVAMTILETGGIALVTVTADGARRARQAREHERTFAAADRLLDAASLWSPTELDQRLGARRQGPFTMRIDRTAGAVYLVSISDSTSDAALVETAFFRPAPR